MSIACSEVLVPVYWREIMHAVKNEYVDNVQTFEYSKYNFKSALKKLKFKVYLKLNTHLSVNHWDRDPIVTPESAAVGSEI
jgi:hypothetical protein